MEHNAFHQEDSSANAYRRIGAGFCGSVWSDPQVTSASTAIKREDGGPGRSLLNDFEIHSILLKSYQSCPIAIRESFLLPKCHGFVPGDHSGWKTTNILSRFPENYTACNILISQRIPPFQEHTRNFIVYKYCPKSLVDNIKADVNNRDCLIRPYLGRRKFGQRESRIRVFSLRNYPLHIDQMADLGLDPAQYATNIARTLAFMHWSAKIDANDVEFVLAPATDETTAHFQSQHLHSHNLWILDFDCCRRMSMDEEGVQKAAQAFLRNDPFYPRPGRNNEQDKELWKHFRSAFIQASATIISAAGTEIPTTLSGLPMDTIERIVQR